MRPLQRGSTAKNGAESPDESPLRIGVFGIRTIPSTYSGYETFATQLLPGLAARGHSVTLYTRDKTAKLTSRHAGVQLRYLPSLDTKQLDTLSHGVVSSLRATVERFDVVLCFNVANALFLPLLRFTGTPTVLNLDGQEWKRGKWGVVAKKIFRLAAHASRMSATVAITDGRSMRAIYLEEFKVRSTVIPYSWAESAKVVEDREQLMAKYGLSAPYFIVGGRMIPENNIAELVRAFSSRESERDLLVLGTANYDSPVLQQIRETAARDTRVRFIGHVSDRSDYISLLHHADCYLHGHSVGGTNPSLIEAMGAKAAIAALDTPFNREALGANGTFFALDNSFQVVERLVEEGTETQRDRNLSRAQRTYALQDIISAYEVCLRAAADGQRTAPPTAWDTDEQ